MLRNLTIDALVDAFNSSLEEIVVKYPSSTDDMKAMMACVHLLFPHLSREQQHILNSPRIFSGQFGDTTASAILAPEFEYEDEAILSASLCLGGLDHVNLKGVNTLGSIPP